MSVPKTPKGQRVNVPPSLKKKLTNTSSLNKKELKARPLPKMNSIPTTAPDTISKVYSVRVGSQVL